MRLIQQGPKSSKIVFVGEAPGATENISGIPFDGGAGEVFNRMLSTVGISRATSFVTNVCHVQPPKNDFNWFLKPKPRMELVQGLVQLKNDLIEIKPNLVVALGAQPLRFLTGKMGIDKWRGTILESTLVPGLKVIGTYHPAYIMRIWDYKAVAEFDLRRCVKQMEFPEIIRPKRELILDPSREESMFLKEQLLQAEYLAEDIECYETPSGWRLACVGFSDRADRAVVWPCNEPWQIAIVKELSESPVRKVFQNGMFDVTVLKNEGIIVPLETFVWDTMLGHHSLFTESASGSDEMSSMGGKKRQAALAKGLAFQTSIYTEEPFYKDDGKLWHETGDTTMFYRYNGLDCCTTREIRDVQEKELAEFGTTDVLKMEMATVEPLLKMMWRGVRIDTDLRKALHEQYTKEVANLQAALDIAAGGSVNVKSPKQMLELLYDKLKLPQKRHRASGNLTANKDAIVELAEKHSHPVLHIILQIRQRRDFIERYLDAKLGPDGRMHCSYDPTGTRTGRLASRASIDGSGTNLQNIPVRRPEGEAIRRMFLADSGKVLIARDYSQAEARLVAQFANCLPLIELFGDPNRDVHTENASRIFGRAVAKLITDGGDVSDDERYLAKKVIHASNYGMGEHRLVQVVNEDAPYTGVRIDVRQAKMLIQKYFMMYPEIREVFWKGVEQELRYTRTLTTPFGRKRMFFGRWDEKLLREAYAYKPQSTVGDLGTMALVNCYHQIEKQVPGAELLLQVHDAIYMQCWEKDVEMVAGMMEQAMNIPITVNDRTFTIPTDCKVGRNWGSRPKKNPEANPNGLVSLDKWLKEAGMLNGRT